MMFQSPFAVPHMTMFSPNGNGMPSSKGQRQSPSSEEEGVKVPRDPFVERQRQHQQDKNQQKDPNRQQQQSSLSSSGDVKIPKDPLVER